MHIYMTGEGRGHIYTEKGGVIYRQKKGGSYIYRKGGVIYIQKRGGHIYTEEGGVIYRREKGGDLSHGRAVTCEQWHKGSTGFGPTCGLLLGVVRGGG